MNKVLTIALAIIVFFFIYLWVGAIFTSCNPEAEEISETITVNTESESEETYASDEIYDEVQDESYVHEDNAVTVAYEEVAAKAEVAVEEVKEVIEESYVAEKVNAVVKTNSSPNGRHLVLAGNYLMEDNALRQVKKLKKKGYSNAEIVVFDYSQYHTVLVSRNSDLSSANNTVQKLKSNEGIDAYVHTKSR